MKRRKIIFLFITMLSLLILAGGLVFWSTCHQSSFSFSGSISSFLEGGDLSVNDMIQVAQTAVQKQLGSGFQAKVSDPYTNFLCQGSNCNLENLDTVIYDEPISSFCPRGENTFLRTQIDFHFDVSKDHLETDTLIGGAAVPTIDWGHSSIDTDQAKTIALKELARVSSKYTTSPFSLDLFYRLNAWEATGSFDLTGNTGPIDRFTIDYQTGAIQYEN